MRKPHHSPKTLVLLAALLSLSPAFAQNNIFNSAETQWRALFIARDTPRQPIGGPTPDWAPPSANLPPGWETLDFNDRDWVGFNLPLPEGSDVWGRGGNNIGHVAARGLFAVEDPARAGSLRLTLAYRGGVVVYLNGVEIARQHLTEGDDVANLLSESYGKEAWFANHDDSRPIERNNAHQHADWLREHRLRHLRDLELPAPLLRPGLNVLAVLVNSAPNPLDHTGRFQFHGQGLGWPRIRNGAFLPVGLVEAELTASGGGVVAPHLQHPEGVRVWPASPLTDITPESFPRPGDEQGALRLVGPRGGQASAPIIASSRTAIPAPRVQVTALQGDNGSIPAQQIRLLHASRVHRDETGARDGFKSETYSVLGGNPGPAAPHQPVWVLVDIPADATPGAYQGTVRVEAAGVTRDVPVELQVGGYRLPNNREFVTYVGMLHQAENAAFRYGHDLWSDAHFARLGQVFDMLAGVGNKKVFLPMTRPGKLGTRETIVRWVDRGDGRLEPDFTHLERYLRLYDQRVGPPRVLALSLWSVSFRNQELHVTKQNPDGSTESVRAPWYADEGGVEFWKPVLDRTREIVRDLGWPEHVVLIASAHDRKPEPEAVEALKEIAPGIKWSLFSHARGYNAPRDSTEWNFRGMDVGFHEEPWGARHRNQRGNGTIGGWDHVFPQSSAARAFFSCMSDRNDRTAAAYRHLATGHVAGGHGGGLGNRTFWGFSRFQFDYWPVPRTGGDGFHRMLSGQGYTNLMRNPEFLLAPGAEGPQPTVAYQQIREGLQETEARLLIELALAHPEPRARLGSELERRCVAVLRDDVDLHRAASAHWFAAPGLPWREHARDLFDVAGAVQQALGTHTLHHLAPIHQEP